MIARLWHGWTDPDDADDYERLLTGEILPRIADDVGDGYRGHRVLRRLDGDEVEFLTELRFGAIADVREFAGEEYERAHVPPEARELLTRYDDRARHYEIRTRAGE